jgi:hypothetical protein
VLTAAVVTLLTLIPFPMSQTVGYQITLTDPDPRSALSSDVLVSVLDAIGYEQIGVSVTRYVKPRIYTLTDLPTEQDAQQIAAALTQLTTFRGELTIDPVVQHITAPLYAQVADKVKSEKKRPVKVLFEDGKLTIDGREFQSIISSPEYSDEQVKAHIEHVLSDYGIGPDEVEISAETSDGGDIRRLLIRLVNDTLVQTDAPALEISVTEKEMLLKTDGERITMKGNHGFLLGVGEKEFKGKSILVIVELEVEEE